MAYIPEVDSGRIIDATIVAADIATGAVTSAKLAASAVTNAALAAGAVSSAKCDSTVARTNGGNTFASGQQRFLSGLAIGNSQMLTFEGASQLFMFGNQSMALAVQHFVGTGFNTIAPFDFTSNFKTVDTTGGVLTIQLPATHTTGWFIWFKDTGGACGTSPLTITTADADLIDGQNSIQIASDYGSVGIFSNGTNWFTI